MTDRCEPRDGTPAGTVCVLQTTTGADTERNCVWMGDYWQFPSGIFRPRPDSPALLGWRFVRVAGEGDG